MRTRSKPLLLLTPALAGLVWAALAQPLWSDTHYVSLAGAHTSPFTSWATAATNIQSAVDASAAGDTVLVSNGTYYATGLGVSLYNTNFVYVSKAITLKSFSGNPADTILAGNSMTNRLVMLKATGAVLDGFTLTNGYSGGWDGGGLWVFDGALVTNCVITGNRSDATYNGGGGMVCRVWSSGGTVTVANCKISGNTAPNTVNVMCGGGGIWVQSNVNLSVIITDCDICWNTTAYEGAGVCASRNAKIYNSRIYNNAILSNMYAGGAAVAWYYGGPYLKDCAISNNLSTNSSTLGGGARNSILDHCTVMNNTSYAGGGVCSCIVSNGSVIAGNQAQYQGGGVYRGYVYGSLISNNVVQGAGTYGGGGVGGYPTVVSNCVIVNNQAPTTAGGGIYYYSDASGPRQEALNCVIMNNTASNGGGIYLARNNPGSTGMIVNCLIAGNSAIGGAASRGGGIYGNYGVLTESRIISCTIASNYAQDQGGGVWINDYLSFTNSIIYNNQAGTAYNDLKSGSAGNTNNFWFCCTPAANTFRPGQGNFTNAPQFMDSAAGNFRLGASSPCVNTGSNLPGMAAAADLDGNPRLQFGLADIGAYESGWVGGIYRLVAGADGGGVSGSFYIGQSEVWAAEYVNFLNAAEVTNAIAINAGQVFGTAASNLYCGTQTADPDSCLEYDAGRTLGQRFYVAAAAQNFPAMFVTWFGAAAYCNWKSEQEGLTAVYNIAGGWTANLNNSGYRLPTEAEWFKAAAWNVGQEQFFAYGVMTNHITGADANFLHSGDGYETNALGVCPVNSYPLFSPYGLQDTSGNAWEWCHGFYETNGVDVVADAHAARGGSWGNLKTDVKTISRIGFKPDQALNSVGFRVVRKQ